MVEVFIKILLFIVGCLAGGISVHLYYKRNCNNSNISQKNINAGGDVAGRDIKK